MGERLLYLSGVTGLANFLKSPHLGFTHRRVVDIPNINLGFLFESVLVDTDNDIETAVHPCLSASGTFLDAQLGHPIDDGFGHATQFFDLGDHLPSFSGYLVGERFHEIRAAPRIHNCGNTRFFLKDQLGISGGTSRRIRGKAHRLIVTVGM